jgi:ketosteroid isomerase-like protein
MIISRFSLALLAALLPALAYPPLADAAVSSVQEANQAFQRGNNKVALDKVDSFLTANPKDAQGRFLKGLVLTEMNRFSDAIKIFSGLTEDFPELPEPYNNLAVLYAAQADYERAKNSLEMAIRTHPSYATAHENLGDIYAKMASQAYDKAMQLDKSNISAQTKLALIRDLFSPTPRAQEPIKVAEVGKGKQKTEAKPAAEDNAAAESKPEEKAGAVAKQGREPTKPATEAIDPKAQVERTLRAWAAAWSARDANAYLSFYSPEFKTPGKQEFADWSEERKVRVTRPEFIKVSIDRLRISLKGNTAQASFTQQYESNIIKDSGKKTMKLVREGDNWKILEER